MTNKQFQYLFNTKLDILLNLLIHVLNKENIIMASQQDVLAAIANESSVDDSIITLLNGIVQQLKDAQASNDPAALDIVIAGITANTKKIQDAVTANTPVTPVQAAAVS